MNNLPNDVIQTIYFYEHKLEFVEVMNQLLQAKNESVFQFEFEAMQVYVFCKNLYNIFIVKC